MYNDEDSYRCPLRDRIFSFITAMIMVVDLFVYGCPDNVSAETSIATIDIPVSESVYVEEIDQEPIIEDIIEPEALKKSTEEIIDEINVGKWGCGEDRKNNLIAAGYDYNEIQSKINDQYAALEPPQIQKRESVRIYSSHLTKSGGVYNNPYTGLKETWYSQRVLPGGGLDIPGRHVNEEGFVCDGDGYICVASSTYAKGTIIETSRGMGKVYDSGCKPGILDIYVDW